MSALPGRDGFLMHGSWYAEVVLTRKFELAGGADAPGIARVELTELLADRISPADLLDVTVLVSQVVTNAVRHGLAGSRDAVVVQHRGLRPRPGLLAAGEPAAPRRRRRQWTDDVAAHEQRVGRRDRRRELRLVRAPGAAALLTPPRAPRGGVR